MGKKTQTAVDTSHSTFLLPENPHIHFFKTIQAKKKRGASWCDMIKEDVTRGNFANLKKFLRLAEEYSLLPDVKISRLGFSEDEALLIVKNSDSRATKIVDFSVAKHPVSAESLSSLFLAQDAYLVHPAQTYTGGGVPNFDYIGRGHINGVSCGEGGGTADTTLLDASSATVRASNVSPSESCDLPTDLYYITSYGGSTVAGHVGELYLEYRTSNDTHIRRWYTGLPYTSNTARPEALLISYEIDDSPTNRRTYYTTDTTIVDQVNDGSSEEFPSKGAPVLPIYINKGALIPADDATSELYKNLKRMFNVLGINYPEISDKLINAGNTPPAAAGTKEEASSHRQYNHSDYLKSKYSTYAEYRNSQQAEYDEYIADKADSGEDNVSDILVSLQPPLKNMGYGARIAFFDSLLKTIGSMTDDSYRAPNPKYTRAGSSEKMPTFFYGQVHEYFNFLFDVGDFSLKIWSLPVSAKWWNVPRWEETLGSASHGHLLKGHRTFLAYGGDKADGKHLFDDTDPLVVPDHAVRTLEATISDNTHWQDAVAGNLLLPSNDEGTTLTAAQREGKYSQNTIDVYLLNGFIRICKSLPNDSITGNQRYLELVLHAPQSVSSIGPNGEHSSIASAFIDHDADGNETMIRKMFAPLIADVLMDSPFFYFSAELRDIVCVHTHYLVEKEIPWYKSWLFKFLLGLIVAVITAAVTGVPIGNAIINYVVSVAVSTGVNFLLEALGLDELGVLVQLIASFATGDISNMSTLTLAENLLGAFSKFMMMSIEKDFERLRESQKKFNIESAKRLDALHDAQQRAGLNKTDLTEFYLWMLSIDGYEPPSRFRAATKLPSLPRTTPPSLPSSLPPLRG